MKSSKIVVMTTFIICLGISLLPLNMYAADKGSNAVTVVNTPSNPVPVTGTVGISPSSINVTVTSGTPFHHTADAHFADGQEYNITPNQTLTSPTVLETLSVRCVAESGQKIRAVFNILFSQTANDVVSLYVPLAYQFTDQFGYEHYTALTTINVWTPGGTYFPYFHLFFTRGPSNVGGGYCEYSVSGRTF